VPYTQLYGRNLGEATYLSWMYYVAQVLSRQTTITAVALTWVPPSGSTPGYLQMDTTPDTWSSQSYAQDVMAGVVLPIRPVVSSLAQFMPLTTIGTIPGSGLFSLQTTGGLWTVIPGEAIPSITGYTVIFGGGNTVTPPSSPQIQFYSLYFAFTNGYDFYNCFLNAWDPLQNDPNYPPLRGLINGQVPAVLVAPGPSAPGVIVNTASPIDMDVALNNGQVVFSAYSRTITFP
jgi:hypothetical protein